MVYFTSDLHFNHDREFIWKARGFSSVQEMNNAIVERWNSVVKKSDVVWVLGDLMLMDDTGGMRLLNQLNGEIHVVRGNHDTDNRIKLYNSCPNIVEVVGAAYFKWDKKHFYLSHYPTITQTMPDFIGQSLLNLYGHTHQKTPFWHDIPYMYNVGMDAHDCTPVSIEQIVQEMIDQYQNGTWDITAIG